MNDLTREALKLRELQRKMFESLVQSIGQVEATTPAEDAQEGWGSLLEEYCATVKRVRTILLEENVPVVADADAREIIQKLSLGVPLPVQKMFEDPRYFPIDPEYRGFLRGELEDEEIKKLAFDVFYSWFGPRDYITNLYETGVLVVGFPDIPPNLKDYVAEARECYAFYRYLAMNALCRAILEICVVDLRLRKEIEERGDARTPRAEMSSNLSDLTDIVQDRKLRKRCDRLVKRVLPAIHPATRSQNEVTRAREEAKETFKETLSIIHELYSKHP